MPKSPELPPIHTVRRQRAMLDSDLARLYGVSAKIFNQTIHRNAERFPNDFAFQITREELANLKSQIVTSSSSSVDKPFAGQGGKRKLPYVFTEHGAIMAATIFKRLAELDKKMVTHDVILRDVYEKLRPLLAPPPAPPRKELGFHTIQKKALVDQANAQVNGAIVEAINIRHSSSESCTKSRRDIFRPSHLSNVTS